MKTTKLSMAVALILSGSMVAGVSYAAKPPNAGGGGGRPGGGGEETATNNLSFPVIFADNGAKPGSWVPVLAPVFADVPPDGSVCYPNVSLNTANCWITADNQIWWLQQRSANKWQAYTEDNTTVPFNVTAIDWGDKLEGTTANLTTRSKIRVETVLYQDVTDPAQLFALGAWEMSIPVPGTENSPSEMRGTNKIRINPDAVHPLFEATVYASCSRLVIQKLTGTSVVWNNSTGLWQGTVSTTPAPVIVQPAGFEINVGGSLISGYNWQATEGGDYRITFALNSSGNCYTAFDNSTYVIPGTTPSPAQVIPQGDPRADGSNGLTYIDVKVKAQPGGGGGRR